MLRKLTCWTLLAIATLAMPIASKQLLTRDQAVLKADGTDPPPPPVPVPWQSSLVV